MIGLEGWKLGGGCSVLVRCNCMVAVEKSEIEDVESWILFRPSDAGEVSSR